jgi:hypothetical protein
MDDRPISDWVLERGALGELPARQLEELNQRLACDSAARQQLAALERSNEQILERYPPATMVERITAGLRVARAEEEAAARSNVASASRRVLRRGLWAAPALLGGAAAAVLLVLVNAPPTNGNMAGQCVTVEGETVCFKGGPQLVVHRRHGADQQQLLLPDDRVHAGDTLQLSYRTVGQAYGAIVSLDGRGTVTVHFPNGPMAGMLDSGGVTSLDHAYELDDAPRFEWFFFVTSPEPFPVRTVTDAVQELAQRLSTAAGPEGGSGEGHSAVLHLPAANMAQTSFRVRKTGSQP